MKKKLQQNIILWLSITYLILFITGWIILSIYNCTYLFYFKLISTLLIIAGIVIGTIIAIKKLNYEKQIKIQLYTAYFLLEGILSIVLLAIVLFPLLYQRERITQIDNVWYVEIKRSTLVDTSLNYYDFKYLIFRKKQPRFVKNYNNYFAPENYIGTTYYDEEGNVIRSTTGNKTPAVESEPDITEAEAEKNTQNNNTFPREVLYTKTFDNNVVIKITSIDAVLARRLAMIVEKSTDGGKTFANVLTQDSLIVGDEAEYIFLNENIGFIKELKENENRGLRVTRDGGKTFEEVIFKVKKEELPYLYIDKMPYFEDNTLKLDASMYYAKTPEIKKLKSNDNGLTWQPDE